MSFASSSLYILPHVPKCAGSTVQDHFGRMLAPGAAVSIYSRGECAHWARPERVPQTEREKVRLIGGHRVPRAVCRGFAERPIREAILIRDPVSFNVSMYNFLIGRPPEQSGIPADLPFETWYAGYKRNRIVRFLMRNYFQFSEIGFRLMPSRRKLAYLNERLSEFWFVGTQSDCNELIGRIAGDLGVSDRVVSRNTAKPDALRPADLPSSLVTRILEDNVLDAELFERWGYWRRTGLTAAPASATKAEVAGSG